MMIKYRNTAASMHVSVLFMVVLLPAGLISLGYSVSTFFRPGMLLSE